MEVKIRLQKMGKRTKHNYRVVAISRDGGRDGRHLEILGHYDPAQKPATFQVDHEKLNKWVKNGAQMSDTVRSLVKRAAKKS
jgi:small subunit ribosomal protein S16